MSQAQKFSTDETSSATEFSTYNTTSPATEPIIFDEIKPVMSSINVIVKSAIRKPQIKQVSLKSGAAISNRINKTLTKNMIFKGITFERLVKKRDVYIHIMNKQVETGSIIDPKHLEDFISNTKNVNFTNEQERLTKFCSFSGNQIENRRNITSIATSVLTVEKTFDKQWLRIKIFSQNKHGEKKTEGGDFWVVQCYNGEISFNVDMYDNNDGSYETFIAVPKDGFYDVSLKLMFSLCEALKDPEEDYFQRG